MTGHELCIWQKIKKNYCKMHLIKLISSWNCLNMKSWLISVLISRIRWNKKHHSTISATSCYYNSHCAIHCFCEWPGEGVANSRVALGSTHAVPGGTHSSDTSDWSTTMNCLMKSVFRELTEKDSEWITVRFYG